MDLDNGSNISGIGLLLNAEKIANSASVDEIERKVKNMYIDTDDEEDEPQDDDADILEEYEQAIEEIESVVDGGRGRYEEDDGDEEEDDEDDGNQSIASGHSSFIKDPNDAYYMQKTRDDHLQTSITKVMENVPKMNFDMEQEIEEERKNSLLEQIEALRDDLSELGVSVDGNQYYVSYDAPLKRIEEVHRRLVFKYNKLKYNSIAEEALVAGAGLLEMICNGKHEYFGCRPDLTGYSDVVKSKLKRIRVETSTVVSRFVTKNNVGVLPRLLMELVPSMITQAQRRKIQSGDNLNANGGYKKNSIRAHISDLNEMLPGN